MTTDRRHWLLVAGVVAPLALGAALIPARHLVDNTNIALLLVVAVVAVASGGRRGAAAVAALSAAAAFNLFHTKPYWSLRIESRDDIETAVLLLVVGLAVGELARRGRRARRLAANERSDLRRFQGVGRLVADGEGAGYVALATASELTHLLSLVDCRFEHHATDERVLPELQADGSVRWGAVMWETARWGLPSDGAVIPVRLRGQPAGRFVVRAPIGLPYSTEQLARAWALAQQAAPAVSAAA
jgi:K+-sensing histidine kinase KdpD